MNTDSMVLQVFQAARDLPQESNCVFTFDSVNNCVTVIVHERNPEGVCKSCNPERLIIQETIFIGVSDYIDRLDSIIERLEGMAK